MFKRVAWLTGMPRSGTNWISQILSSHPDIRLKFCPLFSYEFKNKLDENSSAEEWRSLFMDVYNTKSEYLDQEYLRRDGHVPLFPVKNNKPSVLAIKSNRFHNLTPRIIDICPEIKWIAIIRNPCAVIYSWLNNPIEFPETADPKTEWRTGNCRKNAPGEFWGFDDWKAVTSMHMELENRYPDRFRIIQYEVLLSSLQSSVKSMFTWLDLELNEQTENFIRDSQSIHNEHVRSVFKNPLYANQWKVRLDKNIKRSIENEIINTPMERFLLF